MLRLISNKNPALCPVAHCRHPRSPARHKHKGICPRCYQRDWRARNPMRYAFQNVQRSAQRRKIPFELTFDDFKEFCNLSGYMLTKGRYRGFMHIDRIDNTRGYVRDNIRILEASANCSKGASRLAEQHSIDGGQGCNGKTESGGDPF